MLSFHFKGDELSLLAEVGRVHTVCVSWSLMSDSLQPHGLYIYSPWNSPGQNTGVGSLSLFQGIFPTQGSNPGLLHCGWILYQLSHQGRPIKLILEISMDDQRMQKANLFQITGSDPVFPLDPYKYCLTCWLMC